MNKRAALQQSKRNRRLLLPVAIFFIIALAWPKLRPAVLGESDPAAALEAARQQVLDRSSYSFSSDITQITIPEATFENLGQTSREERLYLTGSTDLRAEEMHMTLRSDAWQQGGNVLVPDSGLEIELANGQTRARQGQGEWETVDGFTDAFAPQGDFLSFLVASADVSAHPPETRSGITFTRYSFEIDGPTFASHARKQLEQQLRASGELPGGMELQVSPAYVGMTGTGELWVGEDGLPLRQILNLRFPAENGQRVAAQIQTDFSQYGETALARWGVSSADLSAFLNAIQAPALQLGSTLIFVGSLYYFRRSRKLEHAVAWVLVASMVLSPILQLIAPTRVLHAQEIQQAEREDAEAQREEEETLRDLYTDDTFDPLADPLAPKTPSPLDAPLTITADGAPQTVGDSLDQINDREVAAGDTDGLSDALEDQLGTNKFDNDTDDDGLDDFQELSLGTNPLVADSDGDQISDKQEVVGFVYAGKTWYLNPNSADSNSDGIPDGQELGPDNNNNGIIDALELDAAGDPLFPNSLYDREPNPDGTPDIADSDNDGDGVPDRIDLSPLQQFGAPTVFSRANPFELAIDNLVAGRDATLDLQLRTVNPEHLWYAYNVLDWPLDKDGQVQDWDGATFADNASPSITPAASQTHGDMRVTPMLEVQIPYNGNPNVPSIAALDAYSRTLATAAASIRDYGEAPSGKIIYVPLSLVNDAETGERVAFSARLPLLTAESWGADYQMRVVWTVQMLLDSCNKRYESGPSKGQCEEYGKRNVPTPIHAYDETFTITGINVREDIATKASIIYEDPTSDPDKNKDDALWALADNLDKTFMSARTDGSNNLEIDVAEIANRFNHQTNGAYSATQRWGVPDYLSVKADASLEFDNLAEAVASLALDLAGGSETDLDTSHTAAILDKFDQSWQSSPIKPTLMYATESSYRSVGMDELAMNGPHTTMTGDDKLTINFAPSNTPQPPTTMNLLSWTPFCGSDAGGGDVHWTDCSADVYWEELDSRYEASLKATATTPEQAVGELILLKLYYAALSKGSTAIVFSNGMAHDGNVYVSDTTLQSQVTPNAIGVMGKIADQYHHRDSAMHALGRNFYNETTGDFLSDSVSMSNFSASAGASQLAITEIISTWRGDPKLTKGKSLATVAALAIVLIIFIQYDAIMPSNPIGKTATFVTVAVVTLIYGVLLPLLEMIKAVVATVRLIQQGVTVGIAIATTAAAFSSAANAGHMANMIGAAIIIAIAWGFFIATVISAGIEFGSPEFNRGVATMVATSLVIYALAILAGTGVGLVLVVLLTLVDLILTIICKVDGTKDCFTITGAITKFVASVLYSYDIMIDLQSADLRTYGTPDLVLHDKSKGYVHNAPFSLTLPITTSAKHKEPDSSDLKIAVYGAFFNKDNFRSSTFLYALNDALDDANPSLDADLDDHTGAWQGVTSFDNFGLGGFLNQGYKTDLPSIAEIRRPAGINQKFDYNFNTAYAVPAYECFVIPNPFKPLLSPPICYTRTKEGSNSSFTRGPIRDLFPLTIGEFMETTSTGQGGYRLAWDSGFPTIYDADGDGVITSELISGGDPNDALWDSDFDGVSDFVELKQRSNGVDYSPIKCDSDNDGLTDLQELIFGTHPLRKDTDNDGREDGEEVYHPVYQCLGDAPATHTPGHYAGGMQIRIAPFGELLTDTTPSDSTIIVTVSSDPTKRDTDFDSIPDSTEFVLNERGERDVNGHPYNPVVANVPPLTLFTELEASGGFVQPGQTLAYTASIVADTNFQPGVLEVREPAALGDGVPNSYALPALNLNTTTTINNVYTVAPLANSGPVTVTSIASARPTPNGNIPLWEWETPNPLSIHNTLKVRAANVTWGDASSTNSYLLSTAIADAEDFSRGEIRSGNSSGTSFPTTTQYSAGYERSAAAPGIACNDAGICLSVWDEKDICATFTINRLYVGEDQEGSGHYGIEPNITFEPTANYSPSASDLLWNWGWNYAVDQLREGSWYNLSTGGSNPQPISKFYCLPENDLGPYIRVYESDSGFFSDPQDEFVHRIHPDMQDQLIWNYGDTHQIKLEIDIAPVQRNRVKARFVDRNGTPISSTLDNFTNSQTWQGAGRFFPSVATDGENFLLAWQYKGIFTGALTGSPPRRAMEVQKSVEVQLINAGGTVLGSSSFSPYDSANYAYSDFNTDHAYRERAFGKTEADVIPTVIWAGDRYIVAYQSRSGSSTVIESRAFSATNAAPIGGSYELVTTDVQALQRGRSRAPQLAYNPQTDRVAYAFTRALDNYLAVKLYDVSGSASPTTPFASNTDGVYPDAASIAYYPPTGGWMVSWSRLSDFAFDLPDTGSGVFDFAALNPDGTLMMYGPETLTESNLYGSSRPISCAAPISEPVAIYDFEELPGDTTFDSRVGTLPHLYCTGGDSCPAVGVAGAVERVRPYSDRALFFDGNDDALYYSSSGIGKLDDDFSVAFWMKMDGAATGTSWQNSSKIFSTWSSTNGIGVGVNANGQLVYGQGTANANSMAVNDGQWHHVVMTRGSKDGAIALYVDGTLRQLAFMTAGTIFQNGFSVGKSGSGLAFPGTIDDLRVFESVLSNDTVSLMYNGEQPTRCVITAAASDSAPTYEFGLERQDPRGDAQPIIQSAVASLTIDADAPITSLEAITTTTRRSQAAPTRYVQVPAGGMVTQIIGGSSEDGAGSGVAAVNVTVNGGSPTRANGTASWVYALVIDEGAYNVAVAATDAVGNVESPGATITIIGDATPPAIDYYDGLPNNLNPQRDSDGNYLVPISANVTDAASGVKGRFVDFKITDADGNSFGWQTAFTGVETTGQDIYSYVEYVLPRGMGDPTGTYTLTARLVDGVGNSAEYEHTLSLALPKFDVSANGDDVPTGNSRSQPVTFKVFTDTNVTITGVVTSTRTINGVEATFVPIDQLAVLSGTVVALDLSNPDNDAWVDDTSDNGNDAFCITTCPYTSEAQMAASSGTFFDGNDGFYIPHSEAISFDNNASFAVQAWIKTTVVHDDIFSKFDLQGPNLSGIEMWIQSDGTLQLRKYSDNIVKATSGVVTDGQWHMVTANIDRVNSLNQIYVDGVLVGERSGNFATANVGPLMIGGQNANPMGFNGYIDEFTVWDRALKVDEIAAAYAMRNPNWLPASVTRQATRANGVNSAEWSLPIPANTEGFHRIDVRVTDNEGNQYRAPSDWQAIIDTLAPRITIEEAFPTGNSYDATGSDDQVYDIQYTVTAKDLHLDESAFNSVCGPTQGERDYEANDTTWAQTLFPNVTWRDKLGFSCHVWATQASPTLNATVCDIYGNCASEPVSVDTSGVPTGQTAPIIVAPLSGQVVDGSGLPRTVGRDGNAAVSMDVHIVAEHPTAMKSLEVYYNGNNLVKTINFTQGSNTTYYNEIVSIDLPGENNYNLSIVKTNWDNSSENSPAMAFTLDTNRPTGTVNTDAITEAGTLVVGSGVLKFNGLITETMEMASVQLSVNGSEFVDVTIDGNTWRGAVYVGADIYEQSINVTVRFIDKAGAVGEVSEVIYVAIEPPDTTVPTAVQLSAVGATGQSGLWWVVVMIVLTVMTWWIRPKRR